jgi:hypothetical protein
MHQIGPNNSKLSFVYLIVQEFAALWAVLYAREIVVRELYALSDSERDASQQILKSPPLFMC